MAKPRKTKTEKLLNAIEKKGGMTRAQIYKFLKLEGNSFDAQLYGTRRRAGLVGYYLDREDGQYVRTDVAAEGPFYPVNF